MFRNNSKEYKNLSKDQINILFQKLLRYEIHSYFYG